MTRVRLEGIQKSVGSRHILKGITFEVPPGGILAVIGPSGCGKTTMLRCILGEMAPDEGRVLFDEEDITDERVERRRIGIVYQDYALFPHMTVAENIAYGMRIRRIDRKIIDARVAELLDLIKLEGKGEAMPRSLSGGEQQRVALARVLAVRPRLLLLDEAFTALDATTRLNLVQHVRRIITRLKLTTILVTHDQEEAFLFAHRVLVLNEGKPVVMGDAETVMKHSHPFVQDFVKMALFQKGTVEVDSQGQRYVPLKDGSRVPVAIESVQPGDQVHVMVKKGPDRESVEVWPIDREA